MTVVIKDVNDNEPKFPEDQGLIRFTVPEEEDPGYFVGRVQAKDPDKDKNGRVYYYIVAGNEGRWFSVDKTYGNIYTKQKLDREERYQFQTNYSFPSFFVILDCHENWEIKSLRVANAMFCQTCVQRSPLRSKNNGYIIKVKNWIGGRYSGMEFSSGLAVS